MTTEFHCNIHTTLHAYMYQWHMHVHRERPQLWTTHIVTPPHYPIETSLSQLQTNINILGIVKHHHGSYRLEIIATLDNYSLFASACMTKPLVGI